MFSKFNRLWIALFLCMFFIAPQIAPQGGYIWAAEKCEFVSVDKRKPLFEKTLTNWEHRDYLDLISKRYSEKKRNGILGEIVAKDAIESEFSLHGKRLVSVTTMFQKNGCNAEKFLRDKADRGFDDIFVVLGNDGWADQRYHPVFHESKYDGRCNLKLKKTRTLCTQLSFQWIDGNLEKTYNRTRLACLDFGNTQMVLKSCLECKTEFQDNVRWLKSNLESGNFIRTASVLCADRRLSIYAVNGS